VIPSPRLPSVDSDGGSRIARWFECFVEHHAGVAAAAGESVEDIVVAGVALRLRFAGGAMRSALFPALEHHPRACVAPAFTIASWDSAAAPVPLPPFPWRLEDVGAKGEVAAATRGSIRTAYHVGSRVLSAIDAHRRIAICWTPDACALPWYERAAPLRTLLHWILEASGRNLVHAAAVALPTTRAGALLAGRGGSGKSMTAMRCLGAGFHYAGDDYVAVSRDDGRATAHTLFSTAKLTRSSIDGLAFLRPGLRVEPTGDDKGVVMLRDVAPERLAGAFPIRALIVPRVVGESASRLRRTSAVEAVRALAPTTLFQLPGAGATAFEQLASLARALPAWSLDLGSDHGEIPPLVARAIEES